MRSMSTPLTLPLGRQSWRSMACEYLLPTSRCTPPRTDQVLPPVTSLWHLQQHLAPHFTCLSACLRALSLHPAWIQTPMMAWCTMTLIKQNQQAVLGAGSSPAAPIRAYLQAVWASTKFNAR